MQMMQETRDYENRLRGEKKKKEDDEKKRKKGKREATR